MSVDPQPRHRLGVEFDPQALAHPADDHIRNHILGSATANLRPGLGIECGDEGNGSAQFFLAHIEDLRQTGIIVLGQQFELCFDDAPSQGQRRIFISKLLQLQRQAFRQRASSYPRRIEVLHLGKDCCQSLGTLPGGLRQLFYTCL